jgi:hypothetical protein
MAAASCIAEVLSFSRSSPPAAVSTAVGNSSATETSETADIEAVSASVKALEGRRLSF